ncbi:hypothetical protein ANOM_004106 [Aspergillus nomiae NRRL 13137]|uniref:Alkyl transferase n=1 Tax=Aspergillus nomiae NRRL (strain ATCC 15546 / NRRL 13137 / CBS 260.88 / M93) TaxID=1509407 RepID=A0A0L1J8P6_ASPN3|nr:uncharacterized protein ANOM_004106 [Aspergillus nomiae NRRL 13137]KNG88050.1 hypothetical protein ANOM_004106 [Aspergillus nomiae NRRL 13137]
MSFLQPLARFFQEYLIQAVRVGPIPAHMAFVMDGNRRFAETRRISVKKGHQMGIETLEQNLEICFRLGIHVVTMYAFSIENFQRSPEEVAALMDLAKAQIYQLSRPGGPLQRWNAKLQVLGRQELLRSDVQEALRVCSDSMSQGNEFVLNICMPYTSRDEIAMAVQQTVRQHSRPFDTGCPITEESLSNNMLVSVDPPLNLLIRTSGASRLSDFLLWQCHQVTEIMVLNVLWPSFGWLGLLYVVLVWQHHLQTTSQKI